MPFQIKQVSLKNLWWQVNICQKWSNESKNFQEHLEHFVSEQKSRFQVMFDQLHVNQYSIYWPDVICHD